LVPRYAGTRRRRGLIAVVAEAPRNGGWPQFSSERPGRTGTDMPGGVFSQMLSASNSTMPKPIKSTAKATVSYSSQCRPCTYMTVPPTVQTPLFFFGSTLGQRLPPADGDHSRQWLAI